MPSPDSGNADLKGLGTKFSDPRKSIWTKLCPLVGSGILHIDHPKDHTLFGLGLSGQWFGVSKKIVEKMMHLKNGNGAQNYKRMELFHICFQKVCKTNNSPLKRWWEREMILCLWVSAYFQMRTVSFREATRWRCFTIHLKNIRVKIQRKKEKNTWDTPSKINMEPTNHPFRKENGLPSTSMIMFQPLIFREGNQRKPPRLHCVFWLRGEKWSPGVICLDFRSVHGDPGNFISKPRLRYEVLD